MHGHFTQGGAGDGMVWGAATAAEQQKSLLLVEDHAPLRWALQDWLALELPNWIVIETGSAEEAIGMIGQRCPDIVLMDIALPLMDGVTATLEMRKKHPSVRCVIMTLHDSPEYRSAAQAAGARAFINKLHMHAELLPILVELRREVEAGPA